MNILDITNDDIARLKNGITQDEITDRDTEISQLLGCDAFDWVEKLYLKPDYKLPAHTEADIIKYLQASEVPPSQWHPAAQEWAKRHEGERIWEFQTECGITNFWIKTSYLSDSVGIDTEHVHRLRADYGKAKEPIIAQPCYKPSDVSYGPSTLEPEVCVWEVRRKDPPMWYITCSAQASFCKLGDYCPYCGKRVGVKNDC